MKKKMATSSQRPSAKSAAPTAPSTHRKADCRDLVADNRIVDDSSGELFGDNVDDEEMEEMFIYQRHRFGTERQRGPALHNNRDDQDGEENGDDQEDESAATTSSSENDEISTNVTSGAGPSTQSTNSSPSSNTTKINPFLKGLVSKIDTAIAMKLVALSRDGLVNLSDLDLDGSLFKTVKAFCALPISCQSNETLCAMLKDSPAYPLDPSHGAPHTELLSPGSSSQPTDSLSEAVVTVSGRLHCLSHHKALVTDIRLAGCRPDEKAMVSNKLLQEGGQLVIETARNLHTAMHRDLVTVGLKRDTDTLVAVSDDDSNSEAPSSNTNAGEPGAAEDDVVDLKKNELFGEVHDIIDSSFRKDQFVCILNPNAQFVDPSMRRSFLVFSPLDPKHNQLAVPVDETQDGGVLSSISTQMDSQPRLTEYYYVMRALSRAELSDNSAQLLNWRLECVHRGLRLAKFVKCFDDRRAINSARATSQPALTRMYQMSQQLALYDNDVMWTSEDFKNSNDCVLEARKMRERTNKPSLWRFQGRADFRHLECFSIQQNCYDRLIDHVFSVEASPKGWIRVGIHVSDVSAWVRPNGHLDQAAKQRFCTLYFPNDSNSREFNAQTSLLPWLQSDCSLIPKHDRLSLSLFLDVYEKDGAPVVEFHKNDQSQFFVRSIVRSKQHLLTDEVAQFLNSAPEMGDVDALRRAADALGTPQSTPQARVHAMKLVADVLDLQLAACGGFRVAYDDFDRLPNPASPSSPAISKVTNTIVQAFESYVGRQLLSLSSTKSLDSFVPFVVQDAPLPSEVNAWCRANGVSFSLAPGMSEPTIAERLNQLKDDDPAKYVLLCKVISGAPRISSLEAVEGNTARLIHFSQRSPYVYFCSPLHRYWDILTHRVMMERLSARQPTQALDSDKLTKLKDFYGLLGRWEDVQNCQQSLDHSSMAFHLLKHPCWATGIVARIKETAMQLTHCDLPSMLTVPWSTIVGHCGTIFPKGNAMTSVDIICRCVDGFESGLPLVSTEEFNKETAGRLQNDGVLSKTRKWIDRRYVGQELRVFFSGQFMNGKFVVQTQVIGVETKDRCRKPSANLPTSAEDLAHYTCMCHSHPSVSNVFFDPNDLGFPKLRPVLPPDFHDRRHFADCFSPLLQIEAVQNSITNGVDKNEENRAYWSQLFAIGVVVKENKLRFDCDKATFDAMRKVHCFSLACIRGIQNGMPILSHSYIFSMERDKSDNEPTVMVTLKHPVAFKAGTAVAVQFSLCIPILQCVFSMMNGFKSESNSTRPSQLEQLFFQPSSLASADSNSSAKGRRAWDTHATPPKLSNYRLNTEQTKAIEQAFKHRVSVIQGPPGTGKTKTAVSLAHLWANANANAAHPDKKRTVLYMGPSNQSIYVAAQALLKLPDVGTVTNRKRIQVTFAVRHERTSGGNFEGSWTHEAENHPEFKDKLMEVDNEIERVRLGLQELKEKAKENSTARRISQTRKKLEDCYYWRYKILLAAKKKVLSETDVFLCTLSKWGYLLYRAMPDVMEFLQPKQIVVDEAAQATEPESFLALAYGRSTNDWKADSEQTHLETGPHLEHIVLVGDHMQLKPVVTNGLQSSQTKHPVFLREQASGFDRSLFARIASNQTVRNSEAFTMLTTQYRMHESICRWPSMMFYEDRLRTDASIVHRHHPLPPGMFPILDAHTKFGVMTCHVDGVERRRLVTNGAVSGAGWSFCNEEEANRVVQIVKFIDEFLAGPESWYTPNTGIPTVVVITPYRAQSVSISRKLKACSFQYLKDDRFPSVGTVSAYQGGEADFVICSWVRSSMHSGVVSDQSHIGFLCDTAQINVAMTRARHGLVLVGNFKLLRIFHAFRDFRDFAERAGTLVNDFNWPCQTPFQLQPEARAFVSNLLSSTARPTSVSFLNARTELDDGGSTGPPQESPQPAQATWDPTGYGGVDIRRQPMEESSGLPSEWHHPSTYGALLRQYTPAQDSPLVLTMAAVLTTVLGPDEYKRLFPRTFRLRIVRSDFSLNFTCKAFAWEFGLDEVLFTKGAVELMHWCLHAWYEKRTQAHWFKSLRDPERTLQIVQLALVELNRYPELMQNPEWRSVCDTVRSTFEQKLAKLCEDRGPLNEAVKSIQQDAIRLCSSVVECPEGYQCPNVHIFNRNLLDDPARTLPENATRPSLFRRPLHLPDPAQPTTADVRSWVEKNAHREHPTLQMPWQMGEDPPAPLRLDDGGLFCALCQGLSLVDTPPRENMGIALNPEEESRSLRQLCCDFLEIVRTRADIPNRWETAFKFRDALELSGLIPNLEGLFTHPESLDAKVVAKLWIFSFGFLHGIRIVVSCHDGMGFGYFPQVATTTIRIHCNALGHYSLQH